MGNYQSADLSSLAPKVDAASDDPKALSAVREEIKKLANDPKKQAIYKLLQKELSNTDEDTARKAEKAGSSRDIAGTSSSISQPQEASPTPGDGKAESATMVKESQSQERDGTASYLKGSTALPDAAAGKLSTGKPHDFSEMAPPSNTHGYCPDTPTETESVDSGFDMAAPKDYRSPPPMAPKKKFLGEFRNRSGTLDPSDIRMRSGSFSINKHSAGESTSKDQEFDDKRSRSYSFGGAELAMRNLKRPAPSSDGFHGGKSFASGVPSSDENGGTGGQGKEESTPKQINIRTCIDAIIESSVVRERLTPQSAESERRASPLSRPLHGYEAPSAQYGRQVKDDERQSPLRPQEIQHQVHSVLQRSLETGPADMYSKQVTSSAGPRDKNSQKYSGLRGETSHGEHNPISKLTAQVESVMKRNFEASRVDGDRHPELITAAMKKHRELIPRGPPVLVHPPPGQKSPGKMEMRAPPVPEQPPHSAPSQLDMPHHVPERMAPQQPRKVSAPVPPIQTMQGGNQFPGQMQGFVPVQTPEGIRLMPAPFPGPHQLPPPDLFAKMHARAQEDIVRMQMERLRDPEHREAPPTRQERHQEPRPDCLGYDPRHGKRTDMPMERPGYPREHRREPSPNERAYNRMPQPYDVRPPEHMHRSPREVSPHGSWTREPSLSPRERQVQEALRLEQQRLAELRMGQNRHPPKPRSPPDIRSMQEQIILSGRGESLPLPPPHSSPHEMGSHSARSSRSNSPHRPQYSTHSPRARSPYDQPPRPQQPTTNASNVKDSPLDLTVKKDCSPSRGIHHPGGMYSLAREKSPNVPPVTQQPEKQTVGHLFHETIRKQMEEQQKPSFLLHPSVIPGQPGPRPPMFVQPHMPSPGEATQPGSGMVAPQHGGVAQIAPQTVQPRAPPVRPAPTQQAAHNLPPAPPAEEEMRLSQPPSPRVDGAFNRNGNPVSTRTSGTNILGNHSPNDILYLKCKLCGSTYGSLHSFRKHFSKAHGCEPVQDHVSIQTISATKSALAKVGDEFKEEKQNVLQSLNLLPSNVYYENQLARYKTERLSESDAPHRQVAEVHPVKSHMDSKDIATVKPYTESKASGSVEEKDGGKDGKKEQSLMKCLQCGQDFPTRDWGVFKRHVRAHENANEMPYRCSACKTGYKELTEWRTHMSVTHLMKACVCRTCGSGFSHPSSLSKHVEFIHKGKAEVEYKCLYCPKLFSRESGLIEHTQEHEKSHMEYYKSRCSDKSSSSSSSPINSPRDQSPMPDKREKDGSPIPDPDADIFRSRTRSFTNSKIAEEAQIEQDMRPRATSFASPFRHAFRNYLERMVEEEHKKQCIDVKHDSSCSSQPARERSLPTIQESPEQIRARALKRKGELERSSDETKMAKLEARMGPPPHSQHEEDRPREKEYRTTRSIMEEMVEAAVHNYSADTVTKRPFSGKSDPFRQFPLQEASKLPRVYPSEDSADCAPIVEEVTKDAFCNERILSAAELAHRIIESRVKHFSRTGSPTASRLSSPPATASVAKEPPPTVAPQTISGPSQNKMSGAGSLKNFIEDLVAAEVNSYDSSEVSNKQSILAQLGEDVPATIKPSAPQRQNEAPDRRLSSSPGVAPDPRDRTESFSSKFDKIRRHHQLKKTMEETKAGQVNTSRSSSPLPPTPAPGNCEQPATRQISAVDVVHATISQAFMSCNSSPRAKETQEDSAHESDLSEKSSKSAALSSESQSNCNDIPEDKSVPAGESSEKNSQDNDSSDKQGVQTEDYTNENSAPATEKSERPERFSPLTMPAPQTQPSIDPPSPFSDCSEQDLQIVLPEDDDEEDNERAQKEREDFDERPDPNQTQIDRDESSPTNNDICDASDNSRDGSTEED